MKRKSQLTLSAAALAAAVLVVSLGMFGGTAPLPAQATVAEAEVSTLASHSGADTAASTWLRPINSPIEESLPDGNLSALGMEYVPVFD